MNAAHFHLLLNHVPILGSVFGTILLIVAVFRKDKSLIYAGLITLVVAAIIAIPTFLSGEGAEEILEEMSDISHEIIHEHEEIAEKAIWLIETVGILAIVAIFLHYKEHPRRYFLTFVLLVLSLLNMALLIKVGSTGGEIRHTEIKKP